MWVIFLILSLVNAAANDRGWGYPIRIQIGPVYLNIFMLALLLGAFMALFPVKNAEPTDRHRLLAPTILWFGLGLILGIVGTMLNDPNLLLVREVGFAVRDYMVFPLSIFVGYRLAADRKVIERFPHILVAAGIAVSISVALFFNDAAAELTVTSSINEVRAVAFLIDYAGLVFALLLFCLMADVQFMPKWFTVITACVCLIGQAAPLHRSSWLACIAGVFMAYLLVPRDRRKRAVLVTITIVPIVIAVLWVGMFAASKVTGWDFYSKMEERVLTLLPQGNDRVQSAAAWDTRTQGIAAELGIWSENPISGRGFGIQESRGLGDFDIGVHHNAWTDILAKTGIVGLIPYMLVLFGSISVGIKMVRDRTDRSFILVGAFSAILGFFYIVLGLTTWSFNGLRPAILIGSTFGLMLRCREIQLAHAERFELTVPELSTEPAMAYT